MEPESELENILRSQPYSLYIACIQEVFMDQWCKHLFIDYYWLSLLLSFIKNIYICHLWSQLHLSDSRQAHHWHFKKLNQVMLWSPGKLWQITVVCSILHNLAPRASLRDAVACKFLTELILSPCICCYPICTIPVSESGAKSLLSVVLREFSSFSL